MQTGEHVGGGSIAHRSGHGTLAAHIVTGERSQHAEVEERDTTVGTQEVVPGMRISERQPELERRAVEEAIDDRGVAITDRVGLAADIVEVDALDPIGDEHPTVTQRHVDPRDDG